MDSALLIAGSIFVLVMLLGLLTFYYSDLFEMKKGIRERIKKAAAFAQNEEGSKTSRWIALLRQTAKKIGETLKPGSEGELSKLKKRFMRAGFYEENDAVVYFGAKVFFAFMLPVISVALKYIFMKAMPAQQFLSLILFSALAGFYLPDYYLHLKTKNRKKKIFEGFPDALDLMVVCVEAGMGLDAAIKRVGEEIALKYKELGNELQLVSLELRAGKPRVDALRNLAMRTDLEDVTSLVTLLIQTDKFGTRVAQALRVHSDSMRTKRFQRAEELAAKIPIKILFPLVFFILPALVLTLVAPGVIKFYRIGLNGGMQ
jgi:tight adherence protein C